MNLTITTTVPSANTRLIRLSGEIDIYTSAQLKQEIAKVLSEGVRFIVLNLSSVEYLDSTGLGLLIGTLKRLREHNGNLVIVSPSVRIVRVFEITGLYKIFDICATEQEAAEKENLQL
ncbi:MAG: STAS domain-containing protein [Capsulimonadaceae bacterium]|nr:STAS domain-containing protein [Capsulimonadaceae bacterium]